MTTTCQICGRPIKLVHGLIAHHGYKRPFFGYQTGSCFGARHLPFEVSRDALGRYIEIIEKDLANAKERLAKTEAGELPICRRQRTNYGIVTYVPFEDGESVMPWQAKQWLDHLKGEIRQIEMYLTGQQVRYADWKKTMEG